MTRSRHFIFAMLSLLAMPIFAFGERLRDGWGGLSAMFFEVFKPSPDLMLPRTAFDMIAAGGPALTPISAAAFNHGRHEAGVSKRSAQRNV